MLLFSPEKLISHRFRSRKTSSERCSCNSAIRFNKNFPDSKQLHGNVVKSQLNVNHARFDSPVADLGEGPGGRPLILGEKKKWLKEAKPAGQVNYNWAPSLAQSPDPPIFSSVFCRSPDDFFSAACFWFSGNSKQNKVFG